LKVNSCKQLIQHTTTNSIEGREISRYNDPTAANVVTGTTVFSDIGASYVDFFGGRSTSYEKKMQEMYKRVPEMLKKRGQANRADAIIGLSVDIDAISGKGSQLFIITAVGTQVHYKYPFFRQLELDFSNLRY